MFERKNFSTREEWLHGRMKGIGGSSAASIVGMNPYKTSLELYEEKISDAVKEEVNNEITEYGSLAEKGIRYLFNVRYRKFMEIESNPIQILYRTDKPYLYGSLDGEITITNDFTFQSYFKNDGESTKEDFTMDLKKGMKGILEIKTCNVTNKNVLYKWDNKIPDNYYIQTLHYLMVTGYDFVILVVELKFTDQNGVETYERRSYGYLRENVVEDIEYLEEKEDDFWLNHVVKKNPPSVVLPKL